MKWMMKHVIGGAGICILVLILAGCPAQAFTARTLDITIQDNTDARITFDYDLTWYENVAVFARIADPSTELAKAFRFQSSKNVMVTGVSGNHAQFFIEDFATRRVTNGVVSLNSPSLTFRSAGKALETFWFARFIQADFSPDVTRVSFPDGYTEEFFNQEEIPPVRHIIGTVS
ncbi:MAG: hypothetical protein M0Q92_08670 [Methanoregula sp.]|jgi:hypothetical protein|nr:hypothetical protein [Methanoregula sp.]